MTCKDNNRNSISFNITSELGIGDHDTDGHSAEFIFTDSLNKMSAFAPGELSQVQSFVEPNSQSARRRRRAVGDNSTSVPATTGLTIPNPAICLTEGKALVFKVEINPINRSLSHYPRYRKNHLMNTNGDFDYGMDRSNFFIWVKMTSLETRQR